MLRSTRLKITDLNPHLSCILCGGYFIDATTITECVHSFCRACIVRYLETSKYCPVCEVQVHKSRPLHYIRADKTLQNIVYKLVPELFHNEMKRRRELYASQPPEAIKESRDAEDRGECLDEKFIYAPDEIFSLSIEYGSEAESQENPSEKEDTVPNRRFLRCPAAVTVSHLKKFIRMKYGIPLSYEVDLQYDKESLSNEYTLMDVAYIFNWRRMGPMRFFYKIFERPPKQLKLNPIVVLKDLKIEVEELTSLSPKEVKSEDSKPELAPTPSEPPPPTPVEQEKCSPIKIKTTCYAPPEPSLPEKEPSNKPEKKEGADPPKESSKKELKVSPLKFLPTTGKVSPDSKPAVMTVAPLTKPSSSLATTSTTVSNGTITHGLYTGISIKKSSADSPATSSSSSSTITHGQYTGIRIKKSPPNTLPPFRISSHLLPPRVPPLKLSPPRFTGLKESKRSSQGKKSKSSRSHDKLEMKVAQLKSASIKSVAPLVISVPKEAVVLPPEPPKKAASPPPPAPEKPRPEAAAAPQVNGNHHHSKEKTPEPVVEDDKMDIDSDSLFEGPLVIAEPPDPPPKEDGDKKTDDDEDEEIDVVDDGEGDSGRGSDASSRAEARSLSGDDDLGSPDPKTPEPPKPTVPKCNGSSEGVLDLSTCGRKRSHEGDVLCHRAKPVANPAVLDKTRQTPCRPPTHPSFKVLSAVLPHNTAAANNNNNSYKSSNKSERNFKCHGNKLTVFNPDSNRPKIVIKNLGPRPSHERFHHHHNHHHHHQRM